MVRVEPIVLIEKAEEVTLTKKNRCAIDAIAEIAIFPGSIGSSITSTLCSRIAAFISVGASGLSITIRCWIGL